MSFAAGPRSWCWRARADVACLCICSVEDGRANGNSLLQLDSMASEGDGEAATWELFDFYLASGGLDGGELQGIAEKRLAAEEIGGWTDMLPPSQDSGLERMVSTEDGLEEGPSAPPLQRWTGTAANPAVIEAVGQATSSWEYPAPSSSPRTSMPQGPNIAAPHLAPSAANDSTYIIFEVRIRYHFNKTDFSKFLGGKTNITLEEFWTMVQKQLHTQKELDRFKYMNYLVVTVHGRHSQPVGDIIVLDVAEDRDEKWRRLIDEAVWLRAQGDIVVVEASFQPTVI